MIDFRLDAGGEPVVPPGHGASASGLTDFSIWFGLVELPFLLLAVYFGFLTARAFRGGIFGRGMGFIAWGFLVMAIGHFNMQSRHFFGYDPIRALLGHPAGDLAWFLALVATWALSGFGFYQLYRAGRTR